MNIHNKLTFKAILICILVLLLYVIWHSTDTAEVEPAKQLTANLEAIYEPRTRVSQNNTTDVADVQKQPIELEQTENTDMEYYDIWEEEHYFAAKVFKYFTKKGFTPEATCAIIGNMMIETSGGELDLIPKIYSKSGNYYGLCQWSLKYYPEAEGLTFKQQLRYLFETMPWEFSTFGWLYEEGFGYEDFVKMTDPAEAAFAFAKVYERCGPRVMSYVKRQQQKHIIILL